MKTANLTPDESIDQNLSTWCFEVGSEYEAYSIKAANDFIKLIGKAPVVDLGCGDGAATQVFIDNGNPTTAVDINPEKLVKVKADVELTDFVTYLSKPVDNIFLHHSLEHYSDPKTVLKLIGKNLKPGCHFYIAVPKGDNLHSVHHAVFESVKELYPPETEILISREDNSPHWKQYVVVGRKDVKIQKTKI